ncbi:MAG TPA: bifunctional oligoribonuclease/PAP phosphatase NrnA [Egibacteraceae bacterium]|nr:bifunctional oligoribonuclease/PAP phosphatase NrnA [Egibacteraceae bacterium]
MAIAEEDWTRAVELLTDAEEVVLACHVDPDGDALGSMLGAKRFLDSRGVRTTASWGAAHDGDPALLVPPQYTFLPGLEGLTPVREFPERPKLFVAFDTGSPDRLGSLRQAAENADAVIVIDHHASGTAFGDVRLVDGDAAATVVLVDELIRRMGGELDRDMATCLYVGLVTDTGRFQHPSTTPDVMRFGARLIAHDIDHAAINRQVWETHSFGYMKLLGRAMERAVLVPEAGLAWTAITQSDLEEFGLTQAETEGLIDVLRAVEAAECACVAKEQPDGSWKVTMRSKGMVDIGHVAADLGGGGHAFAAGFTAKGTLDEVVGRVRDALEPARAAG